MPEGLGMTGHFLSSGQKEWGSKHIGLGGAVRCKAFEDALPETAFENERLQL